MRTRNETDEVAGRFWNGEACPGGSAAPPCRVELRTGLGETIGIDQASAGQCDIIFFDPWMSERTEGKNTSWEKISWPRYRVTKLIPACRLRLQGQARDQRFQRPRHLGVSRYRAIISGPTNVSAESPAHTETLVSSRQSSVSTSPPRSLERRAES